MNNQQENDTDDSQNDEIETSESLGRKPLPVWAKLLLALLCVIAVAESFSIVLVSSTPPSKNKKLSETRGD